MRLLVAERKAVKLATVNRDLNVLKAMLAKAVEWKLLDVNPARDVKRLGQRHANPLP